LIGALAIPAFLRPLRRGFVLLALLVGAAFVLSSCKEKLPPCPLVRVQAPLNQITKFAPGAPMAEENVVYASRIRGVAIKCTYAEVKARANAKGRGASDTMEVLLKISFETLRGAAGSGGEVQAEYFVAVTDRRKAVLNREVFQVELPLPAGRGVATTEQEAWMDFELEGRTGLAFEIYVGFQLTDEETEFNKRLLGGS
jgi:hypothetical protein